MYEGGLFNVQKDYRAINSKDKQNDFYRPVLIAPEDDSSTAPAVDPSSCFDVLATEKGARPFPSLTTSQRDAIASPANGLAIFNVTTQKINYQDGNSVAWEQLLPTNTSRDTMTVTSSNNMSGITVLDSYEIRIGNMVTGTVRVEFTPSAGSSAVTLSTTFASMVSSGFADGIMNIKKTSGPSATDGYNGVIDSVSGLGLELNPVVTTTGVQYVMVANFIYQIP
jgi:hypothetical protein